MVYWMLSVISEGAYELSAPGDFWEYCQSSVLTHQSMLCPTIAAKQMTASSSALVYIFILLITYLWDAY